MSTLARTTTVIALVLATFAAPISALATDPPRRVARLTGEYEDLAMPEPDGVGRAVVKTHAGAAKLCYRFTWKRMEVRHVGVYRRSTDAMVSELYDENPTTSGELTGCSTTGRDDYHELKARRVREITRHPRRFFVQAMTYGGETIAGTLRRPR